MKLNMDLYEMEQKGSIKSKGKFINRELSWIDFNKRVLYCASDKKQLMNERLNFLGITDSNLNEFIAVRFSYSYNNKKKEPYKDIRNSIKKFIDLQSKCYNDIKHDLKENEKLEITKMSKLDKKEIQKVESIFLSNIFPLITPVCVGISNDSVNLVNGQLCIACKISQNGNKYLNIIPIDKRIPKLIKLNDKVLLIEDVIIKFLDDIFINKDIISSGVFKVIKDENVELEHDSSKFLLDRMKDTILKRNLSKPLFLVIRNDCEEDLKYSIMNLYYVPKSHVIDSQMIDYTRFSKEKILSDKNSYKKFTPFQYENKGEHYSLFDALDDEDIMLNHPYDSYETVVKFIEHAAFDPDVLAIKQTLYRVSSYDSPIVNALCNAAKNGKHVAVLIEIKARFDEENNIRIISKLQNAGAIVLLGLEYLKTHCKMCVVIKKTETSNKIYSHIATGNYNEKTAKLYTDISYLTSNQKVGMDLLMVFNILAGISTPDEKMNKLSYSPVTLRKTLLKSIDREIENKKKGKHAEIFMKINSLSDKIMVNKLYEAANKGVKIYIICRGACSLVANENIIIKSVVGRFLEHSRIYYFANNDNPEYYISSADLLTRNLDRRIEILLPIKDNLSIKKLKYIIDMLKKDCKNSFVMVDKGAFVKVSGDFDSHQWMIDHSNDLKAMSKKK